MVFQLNLKYLLVKITNLCGGGLKKHQEYPETLKNRQSAIFEAWYDSTMGGQQSRHWVIFRNHLKGRWLFVLLVRLRWLSLALKTLLNIVNIVNQCLFLSGVWGMERNLARRPDAIHHSKIYKRNSIQLTRHRACLHGGGGHKTGDVTCGESLHLPCKRDQIKMRDYMDRRVTTPKRVTSPTWGPLDINGGKTQPSTSFFPRKEKFTGL